MEMFKKGWLLTDKEFDRILEKCGGRDFIERYKNTLGPIVDKLGGIENLNKIFGWAVRPDKGKDSKRKTK
jgi:phosphotransferase system IIB component